MSDRNPFPPAESDRRAIWEMLVRRDIEAYVRGDWDAHGRDFAAEGFFGIDARFSSDPESWTVTFPDLAAYRDRWLASARGVAGRIAPEALRAALFGLTTLGEIEIASDFALARKRFDGAYRLDDGEVRASRWLTHYYCRSIGGRWRIVGFLGYLPNAASRGA
jgi:hypothetical protein